MKIFALDRARGARFLLLAAALLIASHAGADATRARTIPIKVGAHALRVEVMTNDEERARGLMHRKHLGANDGMLFVFDEPAYHSMWMKDTLIPLSVAFLDRNGVILNILDMEPHTLEPNVSAGPSIYAIETNKGWFAAKKIKPGDKVTGLPKK
jgi:uncharacterized membrane protein (UPF0127 family)